MTRVAVVGLGGMGSRMAGRLLAAGHQVIVWNRSPERAEPLLRRGASLASSPADAARRAEALITMLADPAALAAVSEGPDGIGAGAGAGLTVIEMSTVGPDAIRRLASVLPPKTGVIDAPVLGSLGEAEAGSLAIFVGGPTPLVARVMNLLSVLGSPIHVGALGSGAAAKLVANTTLLGSLGVLGEAVALADGLGLSRDATYRLLSVTPLSAQAERRRDALGGDELPRRFPLRLALKDARLAGKAAAASGRELRLLPAVDSWLADAEAAGLGDRDYASVLQTIIGAGRSREDVTRPEVIGPILDQVNIVVTDMERSVAFYRLLGLDVPDTLPGWQHHHRSPMIPGGAVDLDLDSTSFASRWDEGWSSPDRPSGAGAVVGFRLSTRKAVDDTYRRLTAAGHRSQQPPCDAFWGARYAVVEDPDGNAVGLMSPTDPSMRRIPEAP